MVAMSAEKPLTTSDLDRMTSDDRWLGWGYLGERARAEVDTSAADALALDMANEAGLTYDELFAWANSKRARWFGDCAFGGYFAQAHTYGPRS